MNLQTPRKGILIYIGIVLLIVSIHYFGYSLSHRLSEYRFWLISFSLIWIVLCFVRSSPHPNTKYLKTTLIYIEIYILFSITLHPAMNLTYGEFFLLYCSGIGFFQSIFEYHHIKKIIKLTFRGTLILFLMSVHSLLIFRTPLDLNEFINNRPFLLINNIQEHFPYPEQLIIKEGINTHKINLGDFTQRELLGNHSYTITYQSPYPQSTNTLLIQDSLGNILQIPPQTTLSLQLDHQTFSSLPQNAKIKLYPYNEQNQDPSLQSIQSHYQQELQAFVQSKLPYFFQFNPSFQILSYHYTTWIGSRLPGYQHYKINAESYLPFLNVKNTDLHVKNFQSYGGSKNEKKTDSNSSFSFQNHMGKTKIFKEAIQRFGAPF